MKKANGRDIRGSASRPSIFVVTVLTPATTWTEGFTNRLIADDYSENFGRWQPRNIENLKLICRPESALNSDLAAQITKPN